MSPGITGVHLSQEYRYNGFQGSEYEDNVQSTLGDAVDKVFMGLPTHEDIKQQHHNEQHHEQ